MNKFPSHKRKGQKTVHNASDKQKLKQIMKKSYEEIYTTQKYEDSNLYGTYEGVVIRALGKMCEATKDNTLITEIKDFLKRRKKELALTRDDYSWGMLKAFNEVEEEFERRGL